MMYPEHSICSLYRSVTANNRVCMYAVKWEHDYVEIKLKTHLSVYAEHIC